MTNDEFKDFLWSFEQLFPGPFKLLNEEQIKQFRLSMNTFEIKPAIGALQSLFKSGHFPTLGLVLKDLRDSRPPEDERLAEENDAARAESDAHAAQVNTALADLPELQLLGLQALAASQAPAPIKAVFEKGNPKANGATPLRVAMYNLLTSA